MRKRGVEVSHTMAIDDGVVADLSSADDLLDRLTEVDFQPFVAGNLEPARVEAKLVQQRGVDIRHVMTVFDGVEAKLVGRTVDDSSLDPTAGHPCREAEGMMIAAVPSLRSRASARIRSPRQRLYPREARAVSGRSSNPPIGLST